MPHRAAITAALMLVPMISTAQESTDSALARAVGRSVRIQALQPVARRVTGTLSMVGDSLIVIADPLPRMLPTREAFARRDVVRVDVKRPTHRVGVAFALLFALPGAYVIALSETGETWPWAVAAAGSAIGYGIGRAVISTRWVRIYP